MAAFRKLTSATRISHGFQYSEHWKPCANHTLVATFHLGESAEPWRLCTDGPSLRRRTLGQHQRKAFVPIRLGHLSGRAAEVVRDVEPRAAGEEEVADAPVVMLRRPVERRCAAGVP